MSNIIANYMTADTEGDFVVLLTGMRINKLWKFWKWLPMAISMPRMNRELAANPELGLLHYRYHMGLRSFMVVQYWESWEKLHAWATDPKRLHLPAWLRTNRTIGLSGDVGTWHETYIIKDRAQFECLYVNMPPHGLGVAKGVVVAKAGKRTAKGRLGQKATPIPTPPPVRESEPATAREAAPTLLAHDQQRD